MTTILVTGSAGAFAPAVISQFERNSECLVYRTDCRCQPGDNVFPCDLRLRSQVEDLFARTCPDLVVHMAATLSHDFEEAVSVNVNTARLILETVERSDKKTRVILVGSAAEYGVVSPDENPLKESHILSPVSIYGMTKAWQTLLMGVFVAKGLDVVLARPFNLDGPGLTEHLFVGRIQRLVASVKAGTLERIEIGPLSSVRDYISFGDAAAQIEAIAWHGKAGNVYHVASGVPVSPREILERYLQHEGLNMSCVDEGLAHTNRVGYDVPVIFADISKTKHLLSLGL